MINKLTLKDYEVINLALLELTIKAKDAVAFIELQNKVIDMAKELEAKEIKEKEEVKEEAKGQIPEKIVSKKAK